MGGRKMKTRNTEYVDGYISPILTSEHYLLWIEWTIEGNKVSKSILCLDSNNMST
jgi:hypothetical protein